MKNFSFSAPPKNIFFDVGAFTLAGKIRPGHGKGRSVECLAFEGMTSQLIDFKLGISREAEE
jgi:hypothetical protein